MKNYQRLIGSIGRSFRWKCLLCDDRFETRECLDDHSVALHHNCFLCGQEDCGRKFDTVKALSKHCKDTRHAMPPQYDPQLLQLSGVPPLDRRACEILDACFRNGQVPSRNLLMEILNEERDKAPPFAISASCDGSDDGASEFTVASLHRMVGEPEQRRLQPGIVKSASATAREKHFYRDFLDERVNASGLAG